MAWSLLSRLKLFRSLAFESVGGSKSITRFTPEISQSGDFRKDFITSDIGCKSRWVRDCKLPSL